MGPVETGVRKTLADLGIREPATALELLAVRLSAALDGDQDAGHLAALSRELRLTLAQVADQPEPKDDPVGRIAARYAS